MVIHSSLIGMKLSNINGLLNLHEVVHSRILLILVSITFGTIVRISMVLFVRVLGIGFFSAKNDCHGY